MGITLDFLRGQRAVYITCDTCGLPILGGAVHVEPPTTEARDYPRYSHADGCPGDDGEVAP